MRFYITIQHKFIFLFFISFSFIALAQTGQLEKTKTSEQKKEKNCGCPFDNVDLPESFFDEPLFTADEKPTFRGGEDALKRYTERLIQNPAKDANDSSRYNVFCLFVVEKNGSITHPKILHHSDSIFEYEAVRFIKTMPNWIPGRIAGEPVRCWHNINLYFGYPSE